MLLGCNYIVNVQAQNGNCGTNVNRSGVVGPVWDILMKGVTMSPNTRIEIEQHIDATSFQALYAVFIA
jgi:hypothetical protein